MLEGGLSSWPKGFHETILMVTFVYVYFFITQRVITVLELVENETTGTMQCILVCWFYEMSSSSYVTMCLGDSLVSARTSYIVYILVLIV